MNKISIAILAATAVMAFTAAPGHAQRTAPTPDVNQVTKAPFFPPDDDAAQPPSRPLFTIGGMGVHLWAPVEPHYDANLNRNQAANPLWGE